MREVLINDRWPLILPDHRADRGEVWSWWELPRLASMYHNLKPGDVVYDIGTEEGDLSALYATWGCDLVLVEPNPRVWPNVKCIFEANDLPTPLACFVGFAGDNVCRVNHAAFTPGFWPACADGEVIGDHGFLNLCERTEVTAVSRIDSFAYSLRSRLSAITMDIEGAELVALHGAARTLAVHQPLVWVSIHPEFSRDMYGTTRQDVLDFMAGFGYRYEHLAAEHEHHVLFWHPDAHPDVKLPYGAK